MDMCSRLQAPLAVRFACLCHDLGKGTTPADVLPRHIGHEQRSVALLRAVCERWRVPRECKELAEVVAREHGNIHRSAELNAAAVLRLLERCDAVRRPDRFVEVLLACECDARGRLGLDAMPYPPAPRLQNALHATLSVDTAPLAANAAERGLKGPQIATVIAHAREHAIAKAL